MTIRCTRFACCTTKATDIHAEYVILLIYHCNNGCTNAPHCYVIRTLLVLLILKIFPINNRRKLAILMTNSNISPLTITVTNLILSLSFFLFIDFKGSIVVYL